MRTGLKVGVITLISSMILAIPAAMLDVVKGGNVIDGVSYAFSSIGGGNKNDIVINQLSNGDEIYTRLDTKDYSHKFNKDDNYHKSYNDFTCDIITNIKPIIEDKVINVSGSFGFKMNFNFNNDKVETYEEEVKLASIQKLIGSNMIYVYNKEKEKGFSVVDLSDSSIVLERINENGTSDKFFAITSMEDWNQIVKYKAFTIKDVNDNLFHDIGKYRINVVLKEYFVDFTDNVNINEFKIHSWSNDIYLNMGEYDNSILVPVDGVKDKNYYQVNILDEDYSKLYLSNTEKIKASELLTLGVCYDGANNVNKSYFEFYYFDNRTNSYNLVKTQEIFKNKGCKEKVLVNTEGLEDGKYKIIVSGKVSNLFKKSFIEEVNYEYYFDFEN